ncbi:MAG: ATPase P [Solirubrobacteraceae bacterium]
MPIEIAIPGLADLQLQHLMLDVNGTLTNRGALLSGVQTRLDALRARLTIHLVSADTFGTLAPIAELLEVSAVRAGSGEDKLRELERLGPERSAVIGNGANDVLVLEAAALGVAVIGPEGASAAALRAADVVCTSVLDALDLLLEPKALSATLRP